MNNALPDWATGPPFDPSRGWLPIVCTGGTGALEHAYELIGICFEDPSIGWVYRGRPALNDQGQPTGSYLGPTRIGGRSWYYDEETDERVTTWLDERGQRQATREPAGDQVSIGSATGARGSVVASCPACSREHRISRDDWSRFLERCRTAGVPWINIGVLP